MLEKFTFKGGKHLWQNITHSLSLGETINIQVKEDKNQLQLWSQRISACRRNVYNLANKRGENREGESCKSAP